MMRSRTLGSLSPLPAKWQQINQYGVFSSTVSTITANTAPQQGELRTMMDVNAAGFHKKKSQGILVVNPMTSERRIITSVLKPMSWYVTYTPPNPNVVWTGARTDNVFRFNSVIGDLLAGGYFLLPSFSETDAGIAIASAFSKAAAPDAATFVTLGELKETLRLLQLPVDLLLRRTRVFDKLQTKLSKESRYATPAEGLELLTSTWLTVRYGVIPLVYEIQGLLNALKRTKTSAVVRQTARGFHEVSDATSRSWSSTTGLVDYQVDQFVNWRISYRAGVIYDWAPDINAYLGLRLADLPQSAVELVTLSFVAEWFVNVRDFLGALTFQMRAGQAAAWCSAKLDGTVSTVFSQGSPESNGVDVSGMKAKAITLDDASGSRVDESVVRKTRYAVTAADAKPGIRVKLNTARLVDAFSLLYQRTSLHGLKSPRGL